MHIPEPCICKPRNTKHFGKELGKVGKDLMRKRKGDKERDRDTERKRDREKDSKR